MTTIEKFFKNAISLKAKDHLFFIPEMKGHKVNLYYNAVTEEVFHASEKSITKLSVIDRPSQNNYRHYSVSVGTQDGKQKKIAIKQQLLDEYVKEQIKNRYVDPEVQRSIDTRLEKISAKKATKKNVSKKKTTQAEIIPEKKTTQVEIIPEKKVSTKKINVYELTDEECFRLPGEVTRNLSEEERKHVRRACRRHYTGKDYDSEENELNNFI